MMAMIGDSHAALFGHALGEAGCVKATYGTGSSVMAPVKSAQCDIDALATTIAWHDGDSWCGAWKVIFPTPAMPSPGWRTAPAERTLPPSWPMS
jgi:glycerol kinase